MPAPTISRTHLHTALEQVAQQLPPVIKRSVYADTGSTYASLDQIHEALEPALRSASLILLPDIQWEQGVLLCALTVVHVPTGESYTAHMPMALAAAQPQACATAVTTVRRLLLIALFNIRLVDAADAANRVCGTAAAAPGGAVGRPGTRTGTPGPVGAAPTPSQTTAHRVGLSGSTTDGEPARPMAPDTTRRAFQAQQDLTAAWIAATRHLGRAACTELLARSLRVTELSHLLPADIPTATAALQRAVVSVDDSAGPLQPPSIPEQSAQVSPGGTAPPMGTDACGAA